MLNTWPSRCGASPRRIEKDDEALSGSEYLAEEKKEIITSTISEQKGTSSSFIFPLLNDLIITNGFSNY